MNDINSSTMLFAVIGDPIGHSLSPVIHNSLYRRLELNRAYLSLEIPIKELGAAVGLLKRNFGGFNVTIPHKEAIIPYLDELEENAEIYGAVNTVRVERGRLKGYNTDGYGFVKSLEAANISLAGARVLVVGAGGAARVIVYELLLMGCRITIANRSIIKAIELKNALEKTMGETSIRTVKLEDVRDQYDCIINTTPLGMYPREGDLPVGEHIIQKAQILYDLIYNPERTKFLKVGEKYGLRIINGFSMLLYQGVKAQEIWLERSLKKSLIDQVYGELKAYLEKDLI